MFHLKEKAHSLIGAIKALDNSSFSASESISTGGETIGCGEHNCRR